MTKTFSALCKVFFGLFVLASWLVIVSPLFTTANAAEVTLAWDANSEDNLAGYNLYYKTDTGGAPYNGTGLNEGDSPVTIYAEDLTDSSAPTITLTGLEDGRSYYFALTAFDTDGLESDYSDEVPYGTSGTATHTITAAVSGQGSISPEGTVNVTDGGSQTFSIVAAANYHIAGVTVDDTSVGQVGSYTFENVTTTHTITAIFEIDTFTITATAGENGSISPQGVISAAYGTSRSFTITPADGYHVADVLVDGGSVGQVTAYSFTSISTWHTIEAVFEVDESTGDGDGTGTDTTTDDSTDSTDSTTSDTRDGANSAPEAPMALTDTIQSPGVGPVELAVGAFSDPDDGDTHMKTEWRAFRVEDSVCIFNIDSTSRLTEFSVPEIMLEENTAYYWQARFFDNNNAASEWSEAAYFSTGFSDSDQDGNGVPDGQEVGVSVDLNQDGISDVEQEIVKSIMLPQTDQSIGLSIENSDTVTAILCMETLDVDNMSISETNKGRARKLSFGLINFKLEVAEPGDTATVTVHFSEVAHPHSKWVKLDVVHGEWLDYSGYSQLSDDRMSMTLELVDGGFGDDDGIANGIIIDPSGLEKAVADAAISTTEEDSVTSETDSNLSGCFITGAMEDDSTCLPVAIAGLFFLLGVAAVVHEGKRHTGQ